MKKILLSVFAAAFLLLTGCKSNEGDPKLVLTKFFEAVSSKNIEEAKKYVTKDSEGMMSMMQMGMQSAGEGSNDMLNYGKENMQLGSATVDGDKATVPVSDKKSGETTNFTLKKEDGAWKVAFDKSTLMEMAQKKMKEHGLGNMKNRLDSMTPEEREHLDSLRGAAMDHAKEMIDTAGEE
ncbi:MAG: hypothetical protein ABI683_06920 [Ginsengibacter sp.]